LGALLESRHRVKPALVGHSLGGTLAGGYGEAHPDRRGAIVAVDGLPVFPLMAQMGNEQREGAAAQTASAVRAESDAQFAAYERQYRATVGVTDDALAQQLASLSAQSDRATIAAWLQADLSADLRPQLAALIVPLTEITGYSPTEPFSEVQKTAFYRGLLSGAPKADVVVIAGAKHFVMLDQPALFAAALDRALSAR